LIRIPNLIAMAYLFSMHDYLQYLGKTVSVEFKDRNGQPNTRVGEVRIITGNILKLRVFDDERYLPIHIPNIKHLEAV